jgi:hypothetical protein
MWRYCVFSKSGHAVSKSMAIGMRLDDHVGSRAVGDIKSDE